MSELVLLTSKTCGPCFMLKRKLEDKGLEVEEKSFPEDKEYFDKYGIRSVPRLLVIDGEDVEIVQGIDDIVERIEKKE